MSSTIVTELLDYTESLTDTKLEANPRDGFAIPIEKVRELLHSQEYGSPVHIMTLWLGITGCRICELDNMLTKGLKGHYFFWKLGKNQNGSRHVYVPDYVLKALKHHKEHYPTKMNKLFSMTSQRYRRIISDIRPNLSEAWQKKVDIFKNNVIGNNEYELQVKGMRKTYATFRFYKNWRKYNSPEVALLMTAKEMNHSTKEMTYRHYIEDGDRINIEKWMNYEIWELFDKEVQMKLF